MLLETLVQLTDLFIYSLIISTLIFYDDTKLYMCKYLVQMKCFIDLIQYINDSKPIKFDIIIHHSFTIILIHVSEHCIYNTDIYDIQFIENVTRTLITTEVSALFLTVNSLLKHINWSNTVLSHINRYLFIITFLYYRAYRLSYVLLFAFKSPFVSNTPFLFNSDIQIYMKINAVIAFFCFSGLFALNITWSYVLIERIFNVIHLKIQHYN
jgi:hypothetical protein